MRVVEESRTYQNRSYVLIDVNEQDARRWARVNRPLNWQVVDVTRVQGSYVHPSGNRNYTITFRKDT